MSERRQWDSSTLTIVRTLYAMVMGTVIIVFVAIPVFDRVLDDGLTATEAFFAFAVLGVGVVASMPWIFLSLAGQGIEAAKARWSGR